MLALGEQRCARIGLTGPVEPGAARATSTRSAPAATSCRSLKEAGKVVNDAHDELVRGARVRRRAGRELVHPDLEPGRGARTRLWEQILHVLRLDERRPGRGLARARADARRVVGRAADRAALRRRCASRGPGTDLTVGLLPTSHVDGGALHDRRRHRPHAQPADRGGLHDARSRARRRRTCASTKPLVRRRLDRPRACASRFEGGRAVRIDADENAEVLRALRRARRGRRRGSARSRSSTARAASARSTPSSSTRCSTRTRRATSRSARPTRSRVGDAADRAARSTRARSTSTS